jgi:signal transduction histidine kinase
MEKPRLKIGIRAKLVALLGLVALIPLTAALLTMSIGGRALFTRAFGSMLLQAASAEAASMNAALAAELAKFRLAVEYEPALVDDLATHKAELPPARLAELDAVWPTIALTEEPMAGVLNHPLAVKLRRFKEDNPAVVKVLVTDRFGQLVAATQRTEDFYQADEDWWRQAYGGGQGMIYVSPATYDQSTRTWSLNLCVPICKDKAVVGVAKAVVDISRWFDTERDVGGRQASIMVAERNGLIVSRRNTVPLREQVGDWGREIGEARWPFWRLAADGQIEGVAPMCVAGKLGAMELRGPDWLVVASVPQSEALGTMRWLSGIALASGLAIISVLFLAGLLLADRSLVRRVLRMERATRRVTEGDYAHRVKLRDPGTLLLGPDEIDELADDFNRMVEHVQQSHQALKDANELKSDFISVASHELRTPVSYIMGMVRLSERDSDPDHLHKALMAIACKTQRLSAIIQTMFKLMPSQRYGEALNYKEVKVSQLLEDAYLDCHPFAEQRHQRLIMEAGSDGQSIQVDCAKVHDILVNLIMNAIKFTPDGGTITTNAASQLGGRVAITVRDQGPGIPESELPHIFEPFYCGGQVLHHSSGISEYGKRGMGLGLAVVQHFSRLHGGDVRVHSTPQGCTFIVTLPGEPPARTHRPQGPEMAD